MMMGRLSIDEIISESKGFPVTNLAQGWVGGGHTNISLTGMLDRARISTTPQKNNDSKFKPKKIE